jgi:ABC-type cobalamin/Fe3+-siderophores transport system ATPase subunit
MHPLAATDGPTDGGPSVPVSPPIIAAGLTGTGPVAALRGVGFGYEPGAPVLGGVSAELRPGRVCALIGPNAAGKSTLLKLMLGQLDPWEGSIELAGRPVASLSPRRRAALASYVPQKGGVSFAFSVRQVVAMGRFALGDDGGAVDRALWLCDLADVQHRVFAHLSGGQQQRVLLARAVAQSHGSGRVMLLDEPAAGMDLWHIHQTMRLLVRLARGEAGGGHAASEGGGPDGGPGVGPGGGPGGGPAAAGPGVLVVLHDINLAARYADDVWLMDRGALAAHGPWHEVLLPERLEPVYGVRLRAIQAPAPGVQGGSGSTAASPGAGTLAEKRPVFWIDPADTIDGGRSDPPGRAGGGTDPK